MALGKRNAVMAGRPMDGVAADLGEAMSSRWQAEGHQETLGDPSEHPRGLDEAGRWQSYLCHHAELRDKGEE